MTPKLTPGLSQTLAPQAPVTVGLAYCHNPLEEAQATAAKD